MRKLSLVALSLALLLAVTACASPAGLLLKEAAVQQTNLKTYESMSTVSVDLDAFLMKNSFSFDMYAKQVGALESLTKFYVDPQWFALAGIPIKTTVDGKLSIDLYLKDGDLVIGSSEDEIGLHFVNLLEGPDGEELPFDSIEEFEEWISLLQGKFAEVFTAYLDKYNFSLKQINELDQQTITLPNGEKVQTRHVQMELSIPEMLDMVVYSLNHFVDDVNFQEALSELIVEFALLDKGIAASELSANELEEIRTTLEEEVNPALKEVAQEIEQFVQEELSQYEQLLEEVASFTVDTYIGVDDQEIYQQDLRFKFVYSEELNKLVQENGEIAPFLPGDSISFVVSQQIWNHNQKLEPVVFPAQLISLEEMEAMESIEEFKKVAGEDSLLAQLGEYFIGFADGFVDGLVEGSLGEGLDNAIHFVELKVGENKLESSQGEENVSLYLKNGQLMAPLALVAREMGADVSWHEESRHIVVNADEYNMQVETANDYAVSVNGVARPDIMVEIVDGTSYVNIRTFAEALDWTVVWMEETKSALILK